MNRPNDIQEALKKALSSSPPLPTLKRTPPINERARSPASAAHEAAKKKSRGLSFFEKFHGISLTERAIFTQNLYIMMKSGVPLAQSLGTLALQTKNKSFIAILRRMEADVEKGDSFAQALSQHQRYFSEVYVSMVAAGEASGKLEKIL